MIKGPSMTLAMDMKVCLGLRITPRLRRSPDERERDDDAPWRQRRSAVSASSRE